MMMMMMTICFQGSEVLPETKSQGIVREIDLDLDLDQDQDHHKEAEACWIELRQTRATLEEEIKENKGHTICLIDWLPFTFLFPMYYQVFCMRVVVYIIQEAGILIFRSKWLRLIQMLF